MKNQINKINIKNLEKRLKLLEQQEKRLSLLEKQNKILKNAVVNNANNNRRNETAIEIAETTVLKVTPKGTINIRANDALQEVIKDYKQITKAYLKISDVLDEKDNTIHYIVVDVLSDLVELSQHLRETRASWQYETLPIIIKTNMYCEHVQAEMKNKLDSLLKNIFLPRNAFNKVLDTINSTYIDVDEKKKLHAELNKLD